MVRSNNDYRPVISNAVIETGLEPGTYTVEATTNARGERGSFEFIIESAPLNVCETALGTLSAGSTISRSSETWVDTCDSANRTGRYARYYSFTLNQTVAVTIDLTAPDNNADGDPDTDTVLYLLAGDWTGDFITANDDKDDDTTNSRIRIGLTPGTKPASKGRCQGRRNRCWLRWLWCSHGHGATGNGSHALLHRHR